MPLTGDMSAGVYDTLEPQRQDNWILDIAPPGSGSTSIGDAIKLAIQVMALPNETTDLVELHYLNERRHYAGKTLYEGGTIQCVDFIDQHIATQINAWRRLVYNPLNGKVGWKANYAGQGNIWLYAPNGQGERMWELRGLWPSSVNWGGLDYNSGDKVLIDITLVYDKAVFKNTEPASTTPIDTN
jgi:hypothetical protein